MRYGRAARRMLQDQVRQRSLKRILPPLLAAVLPPQFRQRQPVVAHRNHHAYRHQPPLLPVPVAPDHHVLIASKVMLLESPRRLICWVDLLYTMSMTKERFFFLRLTEDQKFEIRKNVGLQFLRGKSVARIKSCIPCSIRTIYRWISRFFLGGMENLRNRKRTGRPRQGTDRHAAWIRIVVGDQDPAQCPCEFAWWIAQRVRQALGEKFGSVLSISPVRRSLRRLQFTPQRTQRRTPNTSPLTYSGGKIQSSPRSFAVPRSGEPCSPAPTSPAWLRRACAGALGASAGRPPSGGWPAGASSSTGWRPAARRASSRTGCGKALPRRRSSGGFWSRSLRGQTGRFCQ